MRPSIEWKKCPLCGAETQLYKESNKTDTFLYDCPRCGRVKITEQALEVATPEEKSLLSSFFRRLPDNAEIPVALSTNIKELIRSLPSYGPKEKMDNLLRLIAQKSRKFGQPSEIDLSNDYPLLLMADFNEAAFYASELSQRGYVDLTHTSASMTMSGYEYLEEIAEVGETSNRVFVAMWFHDLTRTLYDSAIASAIRHAGYEPLRIDRFEHVNRIDDEIVGQIVLSRFMVADFSGQRHGVYFEAGMMLGLGRNVIWMCPKDELELVHFDVRQYNFIDYHTHEEARKRLYERILAVEGAGPSIGGS